MRLTRFAKLFMTFVILAVLGFTANHYLPGGLAGLVRRGARSANGTVGPTGPSGEPTASPTGSDVAATSSNPPILRIAGSNTIGARLAPALVQAWLRKQGISTVVKSLGLDETLIAGDKSVLVSAHGTKTGFRALSSGEADIAMASRPIRDDEAGELGGRAAMTSAGNEHVIALDGVAVIVHPSNALRSLEREHIADLFTGRVTRWSEVGGGGGTVHVYVRDDNSGTTDTFKERVLRGAARAPGARVFESSAELASTVAGDPEGIGYVSFSETGSARALAVSEEGTLAIKPNRLTVSKEEYLLSRRLFLYTPASESSVAADFVRFALSDEGQSVVDEVGFVGQKVVPAAPPTPVAELFNAPTDYKAFITGARTLPFAFRFRTNSADLDTKGARDLERLVSWYQEHGAEQVMLFGFADGIGAAAANQKLSQQRAAAVAAELRSQGIEAAVVRGFGATLFVDSNDTADGRERNRRVEVWVR